MFLTSFDRKDWSFPVSYRARSIDNFVVLKKNALINIKRIRQFKIYFRNQLEQIRFEVRTVP